MEISPNILILLIAAVFTVVLVYIFRDAEPIELGLLVAVLVIIGTILTLFIQMYNDNPSLTVYEQNMLFLMMAFLYLYMTSFFAKYTLKFNLTN